MGLSTFTSFHVPLSHDPPCCISEVKCLQHIMQCVERAHICPGNPQPEFVEIVNKRGGSSAGSKVAFVDSEVEVKDLDGCVYGCSLVPSLPRLQFLIACSIFAYCK